MKNLLAATVIATLVSTSSDGAYSADEAAPEPVVALILDNDKITVLQARWHPGDTSVLQERPPRLLYFLTAAQLKHTDFDGNSDVRSHDPGTMEWRDRETMEIENSGQSDVSLLIIVPK
jgi:hypothetical protein